MGPRRGCRGRPSQPSVEMYRAALLQWGRDEGVAEDSNTTTLSLTRDSLQWGRDEGVAEDTRTEDPNEATYGASMGPRRGCRGRLATNPRGGMAEIRASMGPRRGCRGRRDDPANLAFGDGASMGPRRGCRGRRPSRAAGLSSRERFNGAATRVSRKTWAVLEFWTSYHWLQWGRDEGVAEDWATNEGRRWIDGASMGPRRGCRGRRRSTRSIGPRSSSFNGAATRVSRKTTGRPDGRAVGADASMGPRRGCRGRRRGGA